MVSCDKCAACGHHGVPRTEIEYEVRGNAEGWYVGIVGGERVTRYIGSKRYALDVLVWISSVIGGHRNLATFGREDLER